MKRFPHRISLLQRVDQRDEERVGLRNCSAATCFKLLALQAPAMYVHADGEINTEVNLGDILAVSLIREMRH